LDQVEGMGRDELGDALVDTSEMLSHLPAMLLDEQRVRLVTNGRGFALNRDEAEIASRPKVSLRLCDGTNKLVAVGEYDSVAEIVRPRVVMRVEVV